MVAALIQIQLSVLEKKSTDKNLTPNNIRGPFDENEIWKPEDSSEILKWLFLTIQKSFVELLTLSCCVYASLATLYR